MKTIITGATGLVGSEMVKQCIANPAITSALVLTRKDIAKELAEHEKVTVIKHDDFSTYPPELLKQLDGAEGCLWAIGGKASNFPDVETLWKVQADYTIAAAEAFASTLAPKLEEGQKFRMVFCSGAGAEQDQEKSLKFLQDTRRAKGKAEKGLDDIAAANPERFDVVSVRPSGVLPVDVGFAMRVVGHLYAAIRVDVLAVAMIDILLNGSDRKIVENKELLRRGDSLLKTSK